jgi:hypothetical protein
VAKNRLANAFRDRLKGERCCYCGERATCEDHFPPRSATYVGVILPACHECNALAGTEYPFEFKKRAELVKEKLGQRYQCESPEYDRERLAWNAIAYIASIDHNSVFADYVAETPTTPENDEKSLSLERKPRQGPLHMVCFECGKGYDVHDFVAINGRSGLCPKHARSLGVVLEEDP